MFDILRKKRSVLYSWVLPYIVIIFIMVAAAVSIFYFAENIIKEEIINSNRLVIEKMKDNMDNILSDVNRFSVEIASSQSIQDVLAISSPDNDMPYYTIYKAATEIGKYKIFNSALKHFYIYLNNLKIVIAPGTVYDQALYYDSYLAARNYSMEQWLEMMGQIHKGEYLIMPYKEDTDKDALAVSFVRSLSLPMLGNYSGNLVILMDYQEFLVSSANENQKIKESSFYILDRNSGLIAGEAADGRFSNLSYNELRGNYGNITKSVEGKKVIISYTTSKVNGWKFVTITPESVFWEKVQFIRNILIAALILCTVLSAFISCLFLRKNYNPLRDIVTSFQKKLHAPTNSKNNEYDFIKQAFLDTFEQRESIRLKLEQQNQVLKAQFISSLLKGKELYAPMHELLSTYNMNFKYSHFTVLIFYIEDINESFWNENNHLDADRHNLLKSIILSVEKELANHSFYGFMTEVDNLPACLINMDPDENYKEILLGFMKEAVAFIGQNCRITLNIAAGSWHQSFEGIPEAFNEAVKTMEYSKVMGLSQPVFYSDIAIRTQNYYYPVEKEYQLINCIKSADYIAIKSIVDDIFDRNFVNSTPSLEIIRCLMFDLISTILKTANEVEKIDSRWFMEKMNPLEEMMKCKTFLEMKQKMLEILKQTCEFISQSRTQADYRVRDLVVDTIKKEYSNPNLGIGYIADRIGMHPYYVSRVFKEQTGEGILDYINKERILKSKELLKEKAGSNEEIAEKVGYTSIRTFQRAFKRLEGTTPGKLKG